MNWKYTDLLVKKLKKAFDFVIKSITKKELDYINAFGQFGIITPYRTGYTDEKGEKHPPDYKYKSDNKRRLAEFVNYLDRNGYKYERADGIFPVEYANFVKSKHPYKIEKSLLIYNISFNELRRWGDYFNQDAIIFKPSNGVVGFYNLRNNTANVIIKHKIEPNLQSPHTKFEEQNLIDKDDYDFSTRFRNIEIKYEFDWSNTLSFEDALNYKA